MPSAQYSEPLDDTGHFLALAARGRRDTVEQAELRGLFRRLGEPRCRSAAQRNQVEALVGSTLASELESGELSDEWRSAVERNQKRVQALIAKAGDIARLLEIDGCRHAVVESGGTLLGSGLPTSAFCSGDFDILVDPEHLAEALLSAEAAGFVPTERRDVTSRVELRRDTEEGVIQWIAIGAVPFDRTWVPLPLNDRSALWLSRTVPSPKSAYLRILDPSDALVFVAIHTSLHSFVRAPGLRLHVDVDRVVRDNLVDWDRAVGEIRASGAATRAFVSLAMAAGLLGTPIPKEVLDELHPGPARWAALRNLVARAGTIVDGRTKLPRGQAVALDALLDERGPIAWARSIVAPPESWMRERFGRGVSTDHPLLNLHLRRAKQIASRWKPR